MRALRVRRLDGVQVECDERQGKVSHEGVILSEERWKRFCASLPKNGHKKGRPVALIAAEADTKFEHPLNAQAHREYEWHEILRWLERLASPPQLDVATLKTRQRSRV